MPNRREVLSVLKTKLEELKPDPVKTVVRVYTELDITQYKMEDLPLIAIKEPMEETDTEMTSQRSIMILGTNLIVYFLDWAIDPDATKYEALVKAIRDKLGANFTLDEKATETRVAGISEILGTLPVYHFVMELEMRYYLNEQST